MKLPDAVIIELEFRLETSHNPYGHFVILDYRCCPNKLTS